MVYFKVDYTIYNVDGTVRKTGTICKLIKGRLRRIFYLKNLYGRLVEFSRPDYFPNHTVSNKSIYDNFEYFWDTFHYQVNQYKHSNKHLARKLWDKTIELDLKKKAINNINRGIKIDAYDYLKNQLKL